ncbi:hypothetical protein FD754_011905, partial [Muntiacus muntjak]
CGGAVGAILTWPLEVVKTRPQSSAATPCISAVQLSTMAGARVNGAVSPGPLHCLKVILEKEGPRAIYFAAYSNRKEKLNGLFDIDSTQVHMISAAMTGIYWTERKSEWVFFRGVCIVGHTDGLRGFYRGMSASYAGISETVIHFAIYENIKQNLLEYKTASTMENEEESIKKSYPHEVVRTRLCEEGTKYRSFVSDIIFACSRRRLWSPYRGLTTHLVRQIPSTAIMMATYDWWSTCSMDSTAKLLRYKEGRPKEKVDHGVPKPAWWTEGKECGNMELY